MKKWLFGNSDRPLSMVLWQEKKQSKEVKFYNLDIIISVGYRVKSIQGTRFRQWVTERLNEYIVKGFTMDDSKILVVATIGKSCSTILVIVMKRLTRKKKIFQEK